MLHLRLVVEFHSRFIERERLCHLGGLGLAVLQVGFGCRVNPGIGQGAVSGQRGEVSRLAGLGLNGYIGPGLAAVREVAVGIQSRKVSRFAGLFLVGLAAQVDAPGQLFA